jgi:hypothetical protein
MRTTTDSFPSLASMTGLLFSDSLKSLAFEFESNLQQIEGHTIGDTLRSEIKYPNAFRFVSARALPFQQMADDVFGRELIPYFVKLCRR